MLSLTKRLKGFEDLLAESYSDIQIVDILETHEDSILTFQKTLLLLQTIDDLNGIFITCGRVSEVGKAVKFINKEKSIKIISYDLYSDIVGLVRDGTINITIGQDLYMQGYKPVKILFDYIFNKIKPKDEYIYTAIDIRCRENISFNVIR